MVGAPVHPYMLTELAPLGLDREAERFVARQFVPEFIESADLVLGAEPRHRSTVVERAPGALPITFGLREFARLAASVDASALPPAPVARAHMLVERARDRRGLVPQVEPEDDVIPDPIGGPRAAASHSRGIDQIGGYDNSEDRDRVRGAERALSRGQRALLHILADYAEQVSSKCSPIRM